MKRGNENDLLVRIGYEKKNDEYQLLISTDRGETWGLSIGCKCMLSDHDKPTDEPMFVSISLIEELKKAIAFGYTMTY